MKELLNNILNHLPEEDLVLVTIIAQTGSTPRGNGVNMLMGRRGRISGTVGGGAIEGQAMSQALTLLDSKRSCRIPYDLAGSSGQSLDMVCGGGVELLFSYIEKQDACWQTAAQRALQHLTENLPGTLILSEAAPPVFAPGPSDVPFGGCWVADRFLLPLPLQQRVVIFGGGHVAQALVPVLSGLDFRVTVFENRSEFANPTLFSGAHEVILGDYAAVTQSLTLKEDDFYIIMTHGHDCDYLLQEQLLRRKFAYLGVMGSRRKTASVNARLRNAGVSEEAIRQVHTPIGLPIQAVTPGEIAISIAAECIAVRAEMRKTPAHICPSLL